MPLRIANRVLVADDDRDTADSFAMLLSLEGFDVRCAYDGVGALAVVDGWDFDAACLDLLMPGMDGFELAGRLQSACRRRIVLLAITSQGDPHTGVRCRSSGFHERLVKPFDPAELVAALKRWTTEMDAAA